MKSLDLEKKLSLLLNIPKYKKALLSVKITFGEKKEKMSLFVRNARPKSFAN